MKKAISLILSVLMCVCALTACGEDKGESGDASAYTGVLTKVKLGMPLTKIIKLQPDGVELYYENDTTIWSINSDTDLLQDLKELIPEGEAYYYANDDDSIVTYYLETQKGDQELYLKGYSEEVHCLLDRETAQEYFDKKTEQLMKKHGVQATGIMTGTEDVDMVLDYVQKLSASSYDVKFTMTLTYGSVDDVEGYYATEFSIELMEKAIKNEIAIDSPAMETKEK